MRTPSSTGTQVRLRQEPGCELAVAEGWQKSSSTWCQAKMSCSCLCLGVAEAIEAYEQVLAKDPADTRARLLRGVPPCCAHVAMR